MSAWARVETEAARLRHLHLRDLIAADPDRFGRFAFTLDDLTLDLSKEKWDAAALKALLDLARARGVEARREAMAAGELVNTTERRAALHMALRDSVAAPPGDDMAGTRARFLAFAEDVRGSAISDVINIGIGGSDLGPAMAARALTPDCDGPRLHFVSNVDGAHFADAVRGLDPARTLAIVVSKSFTTAETLANACLARDWLAGRGQMAAVSTNLAACAGFGIPEERVFGFWSWVGGRYSVWSAVGLSLAIGIGAGRFGDLLAGAAAMDAHFLAAPLDANLPVLMALAGIWRRNAMGWPTVAVIPYDQRLARLPAYLQQLVMESNAKRISLDGTAAAHATAPVVWGEPGTCAQHSFFQGLHQGTDVVPVDFIAAAEPRRADPAHHEALVANMLAQGAALAFGRTEAETRAEMAAAGLSPAKIEQLAPHRTFPGDRPSTTVLYRRLDPFALGRLIALYEHKVFVEGAIWGIDSFDQWGVELGKALAGRMLPVVRGAPADGLDSATTALAQRLRNLRHE